MNLPPLERLAVIDIQPGDVVIATIDPDADDLSAKAVHGLKARLRELFPDNEVVVVHQVELTIARPMG